MVVYTLRQALFVVLLIVAILSNDTFIAITRGGAEEATNAVSISQITLDSKVSDFTYDFGQAREGMVLRHALRIYNPSSEEIGIVDVKTDCTCTIPGQRPKSLLPMFTTTVPLEIRLAGNSSGLFERKVTIGLENSDDITLRIKGRVAREYPKHISFGNIKQGECQVKEFTLTPPPGINVNVKEIHYDKKFFKITANKGDNGSNITSFRVQTQSKIPTGAFSKRMTILTDDPFMPEKTLSCDGYVLDWLETTKKRLFLGALRKGQAVTRRITISSPYNKKISQLKITSSNPDVLNYKIAKMREDYTSAELDVLLDNKQNVDVRFISEKLKVEAKVDGKLRQLEILVLATVLKSLPESESAGQ